LANSPKHSPNNANGLGGEQEQNVKFPKRLRHNGRGKALATIYQRPDGFRLYWRARVDGKPRSWFKDFPTYSAAKREGDKVVSDLAKSKAEALLSQGQARDALAALDVLRGFYEANGQQVNLRSAAAQFAEAARKLRGMTLGEAVEQYVRTVAVVKRKDLAEAVAEFVEGRKHLAESKDGKRPKHSPVYEAHVKRWLEKFAAAFPAHAVSDLAKEHLNLYFGAFGGLSAKSRNDRRVTVKMFLRWCSQQDYLMATHRLFEATGFKAEDNDVAEIDFYRAKELQSMLDNADESLRPVIALGGLAGLRREEILRLGWADVWRVKGKVEIGSQIAKGRKRRLVTVCPTLASWLRPYRNASGQVWPEGAGALEKSYAKLRADLKIPARRNGLRHGFVTFHMAMHCDENLCAAEAGNSPQMIHQHYKGLATKKEAVAWFATKPKRIAGAANVIPFRKGAAQ
jgi:integrase